MAPPRLAVEPDRRRPSPLSSTALANQKRTSNFAPKSAPAAASATAHPADRKTLEAQLIDNLRQQVSVMELEMRQLKGQQQQQAAGGTQSRPGTAPSVRYADPGSTRLTMTGQSVAASGRAGSLSRANLIEQVEALEAEVAGLREAYARREQEHAIEVAELRNAQETGFLRTGVKGSAGSGGMSILGDRFVEVAEVDERVAKEVARAKESNATKIVQLEKSVERLQAESQTHEMEIMTLIKEKEEVTRDLINAKDAARTAITNLEVLQRQYQETVQHLGSEQDRRRDLENREKDLKEKVAELSTAVDKDKKDAAGELEAKLRETTTALQMAKYEIEKMKVTSAKQDADMAAMVEEKANFIVSQDHTGSQMAAIKADLTKAQNHLKDVESEREFFRLSTDRLKVENSVLSVKVAQLEAKNNTDRSSVLTLERQYTAALEQIEQLRRELRSKEQVYKKLDEHDETLRRQNHLVVDDMDHLRRQNEELKAALADVSAKYNQIKDHGDVIRTEQQLREALSRLDKTKSEMHNLLQTQVKLSNDLSTVMGGLPEEASVHHHRTPDRTLHASSVAAAGIDRSEIPLTDASAVPVAPQMDARDRIDAAAAADRRASTSSSEIAGP